MDPVSQAVVGAVVSQSAAQRDTVRMATVVGACSAVLADLDVFIRSADDPLLSLEYHRHFTHSLVFVPVGGLLGALLVYYFARQTLSVKKLLLFSFLGYLTAAPLDACTSYGTHLFWPFSGKRVAWNVISIVDPIFTITLVVICLAAARRRRPNLARFGVLFALGYLMFGYVQHERAESAAIALISERGHELKRISVRPSLGNLVLWRIVYEQDDALVVDAVNVGLFQSPRWYVGDELPRVYPDRDFPHLSSDSVLKNDIDRFAFFSDNYLAFHPQHPNALGDLRYAMLPNSTKPLWGIKLNPQEPEHHVQSVAFRNATGKDWNELFRMILRK